eukprot:CAMPEP_0174275952 /NCGR_PEP_ID=MMETSP0439-20130205/60120_1 /TAXON_ID=0 /ORGANISM="Stereomyxa ramosa, Strain Chinc5" /LENGTH=815 /DNA_ID=CAMNT_0015368133 /DNA_START=395 /DNA_END=2842 /DNA_ORIENTATION=-
MPEALDNDFCSWNPDKLNLEQTPAEVFLSFLNPSINEKIVEILEKRRNLRIKSNIRTAPMGPLTWLQFLGMVFLTENKMNSEVETNHKRSHFKIIREYVQQEFGMTDEEFSQSFKVSVNCWESLPGTLLPTVEELEELSALFSESFQDNVQLKKQVNCALDEQILDFQARLENCTRTDVAKQYRKKRKKGKKNKEGEEGEKEGEDGEKEEEGEKEGEKGEKEREDKDKITEKGMKEKLSPWEYFKACQSDVPRSYIPGKEHVGLETDSVGIKCSVKHCRGFKPFRRKTRNSSRLATKIAEWEERIANEEGGIKNKTTKRGYILQMHWKYPNAKRNWEAVAKKAWGVLGSEKHIIFDARFASPELFSKLTSLGLYVTMSMKADSPKHVWRVLEDGCPTGHWRAAMSKDGVLASYYKTGGDKDFRVFTNVFGSSKSVWENCPNETKEVTELLQNLPIELLQQMVKGKVASLPSDKNALIKNLMGYNPFEKEERDLCTQLLQSEEQEDLRSLATSLLFESDSESEEDNSGELSDEEIEVSDEEMKELDKEIAALENNRRKRKRRIEEQQVNKKRKDEQYILQHLDEQSSDSGMEEEHVPEHLDEQSSDSGMEEEYVPEHLDEQSSDSADPNDCEVEQNSEVKWEKEVRKLQVFHPKALQLYLVKSSKHYVDNLMKYLSIPMPPKGKGNRTKAKKAVLIVEKLAPESRFDELKASLCADLKNGTFKGIPIQHKIYREFFNSIDIADKMFYCIALGHRSRNWATRMLFYMIRIALNNSWVVYEMMHDCMALSEYRKQVALGLLHLTTKDVENMNNKFQSD